MSTNKKSPVSRSGRFASGPAADVAQFTESISFDWRLWKHDILGSMAHAEMLYKIGVHTKAELTALADKTGVGHYVEDEELDCGGGQLAPQPWSPASAPLQRTGMVGVWARIRTVDHHWVIEAVGRDRSWTAPGYAARLGLLNAMNVALQNARKRDMNSKPVIYLYPPRTECVRVDLAFPGVLTTTAPVATT